MSNTVERVKAMNEEALHIKPEPIPLQIPWYKRILLILLTWFLGTASGTFFTILFSHWFSFSKFINQLILFPFLQLMILVAFLFGLKNDVIMGLTIVFCLLTFFAMYKFVRTERKRYLTIIFALASILSHFSQI